MANGFGTLYIGASGLQSAQNGLNTTSNNLANVNTPGYVRQQVIYTDRNYNTYDTTTAICPQQTGLGVKIGDVVHMRDVFLDRSYRTISGRQAFYGATAEAIDEVYTFYQELEGKAFQDSLEDFWVSFQEFAKRPDDTVNQNLVIQKAHLFITRAAAVYKGFRDYQSNINTQISNDIDRINELGNTIYELNLEIQKIEAAGIETAMTLRDQRDAALDELSAYADIQYKESTDGVVKVKLEGTEFIDSVACYKIGKRTDDINGFITPYWIHSSNPSNGDYDELYNFTVDISSELGTDMGELKALVLARGDRTANYRDIEGLTARQYNTSTADSIAAGMSVMMSAEAQLDQLVHGIVTAINDVLCPNIECGAVTGLTGNDILKATDADGKIYYMNADTLILDVDKCSYGVDMELPPAELFTRLGTERYTKVEGEDGNTYYIYNKEDPSDTSKQYTLGYLSVNEVLREEETKLPHLTKNGGVDQGLADRLVEIWDEKRLNLDPSDTNALTFMDYYSNMIGNFGTLGSIYESTAIGLTGSVESTDNQRAQVIGVSSDEELTKMIKYQNAYNAASRFINVVDEMIEHLLTRLGA